MNTEPENVVPFEELLKDACPEYRQDLSEAERYEIRKQHEYENNGGNEFLCGEDEDESLDEALAAFDSLDEPDELDPEPSAEDWKLRAEGLADDES